MIVFCFELHGPSAVWPGPSERHTGLLRQLGLPSLTTRGRSGFNDSISATAKSRTRYTHEEELWTEERRELSERRSRGLRAATAEFKVF